MDGVVRTMVGYAGGTTENPTYTNLGDHTETVRIEFDPSRMTYGDLLAVFWASHNPMSVPWSTQYKPVIFYNSEEQRALAEETKASLAEAAGAVVHTEILEAGVFTPAEEYHQKYGLQNFPGIFGEFKMMYPEFDDLVDSTAAARVNGYVRGYGTVDELVDEIHDLGLSDGAKVLLLEWVSRVHGESCPAL